MGEEMGINNLLYPQKILSFSDMFITISLDQVFVRLLNDFDKFDNFMFVYIQKIIFKYDTRNFKNGK